MRKLEITPWTIRGRSLEDREFRESIFSVGNGYMGTRGYRPDEKGENRAWRTTFLSGYFEYIQPGITDMVNQPDFSNLNIELNGVDSGKLLVTSYEQALFMRKGLLEWRFVLTDPEGRRTDVLLRKFLSMDQRHLAAVSLKLTPVNWSGSGLVSGGIDGSVENLPISDDQLAENVKFAKMWGSWEKKERPEGGTLTVTTAWSGRKTVEGYKLTGEGRRGTRIEEKAIYTTLESELEKGVPWSVYKVAAVASYRDGDPEEIVERILEDTRDESFDELLERSAKAWEAIWDDCDVMLHGDDELQGAVRYNIFELICATPHGDPHASIGARGLTHGRYKGCYFWDTEIFMLPFLVWTRPEDAKNLLMYRYNTLPDAIESAKRFSTVGARYS